MSLFDWRQVRKPANGYSFMLAKPANAKFAANAQLANCQTGGHAVLAPMFSNLISFNNRWKLNFETGTLRLETYSHTFLICIAVMWFLH